MTNGPATHSSIPVTGSVFVCGPNIYTITSGTVSIVMHEGSSASGNLNGTFTGTLGNGRGRGRAGNLYWIVGAVRGGFTVNGQTGGSQTTFAGKLQIVGKGGTADSVNVPFRADIGYGILPPQGVQNELRRGEHSRRPRGDCQGSDPRPGSTSRAADRL